MSEKKIARRSKVKPFVKMVNYNHLLPTRYTLAQTDLDLKGVVDAEKMATQESRKEVKKELKKVFNDKYQKPSDDSKSHTEFFFRKLRF